MGFELKVMGLRTSVIIPVRNGETHVVAAIDSVIEQLHPQDEILIVDDASTDRTRTLLTSLRDPRIRILDGAGCGPSAARNKGLGIAQGEFAAFLDHDDLWPCGRHAALVQALIDSPDVDAAFGRIRIRIDDGAEMTPRLKNLDNCHAPYNFLLAGLYRRRLLDRIDGFAEDMRYGEDADYVARLEEFGMRALLCDVDAVVYRQHATNASRDHVAVHDGMMEVIRRRIVRARLRDTRSANRSGHMRKDA